MINKSTKITRIWQTFDCTCVCCSILSVVIIVKENQKMCYDVWLHTINKFEERWYLYFYFLLHLFFSLSDSKFQTHCNLILSVFCLIDYDYFSLFLASLARVASVWYFKFFLCASSFIFFCSFFSFKSNNFTKWWTWTITTGGAEHWSRSPTPGEERTMVITVKTFKKTKYFWFLLEFFSQLFSLWSYHSRMK